MRFTEAHISRDTAQTHGNLPYSFRWWIYMWLTITTVLTISTDYSVLHSSPNLLHNWRGVAIFALSLIMLLVYGIVIAKKAASWPPPLLSSLAAFTTLYSAVFLLTLINNNFTWDFYIVLGVVLSRFAVRRLLLLVTILFLTFCIFGGIISWPFDWNQISGILGIGISFYGTAASAIVIQNMIGERYKRNRLLAELTQAHNELARAHQKLAESAAQEQELAVLRERNRLAREMHDTLGHALVLVTVKLEVAQRLRERDPERSNSELEATQSIVRESMNELRASIANLRSPTLELESACRALSHSAYEMAHRTGIHVTCDLQPDIERLPEQIEETLWKVGQEAIANIEKHAHASNVLLQISRYDGSIYMHIEDDGIGLHTDFCQRKANGQNTYTSPVGHYGLSGMTERVERIGGSIHLKPGKEHGTIVEVVLPLVTAPMQIVGA